MLSSGKNIYSASIHIQAPKKCTQITLLKLELTPHMYYIPLLINILILHLIQKIVLIERYLS
jgi:hypothetical protein